MKRYIRANSIAPNMEWGEPWRPYSGSQSYFETLYVNGEEVGYVESYDIDGEHGSIAYLKAAPNEYEKSLGTFKSSEAARKRLEEEVLRVENLIDSFSEDNAVTTSSRIIATTYNISWYTQTGSQCGENVDVPDGQEPYGYIDRYLRDKYGDDYGGIADYIEDDEEYGDVWDEGYEPIISASYAEEIDEDAEDEDDDGWWSPYDRGIYRVDGKRVYNTDDPKDAIEMWVRMQEEAPTDVCIMCRTREEALVLVKAGTADYLTELYDAFPGSPYKLDWLIEECQKQIANGCKYFHEDGYGYGDSVHPFGVG